MSRLKILSLNVRGLRKQEKRRAIFCYAKRQKASIFCLQETFSKKEDVTIWRAEWRGQIILYTLYFILSHGSEHSNLKLTTENFFVVNVNAPTDCQLQTPFLQKPTYLSI